MNAVRQDGHYPKPENLNSIYRTHMMEASPAVVVGEVLGARVANGTGTGKETSRRGSPLFSASSLPSFSFVCVVNVHFFCMYVVSLMWMHVHTSMYVEA